MRRLILASTMVLMLLTLSPAVSFGESSVFSFQLGFKTLAGQIPDVVGTPLEDEHHEANGDSLQQTTTGLMVWRKADNWTAFTNGSRTWINGPYGIQERSNDDRFPWEARQGSPPAPPKAQLSSQAALTTVPVASASASPGFGVAEAFRYDGSSQLGINWERIIFSWSDIQLGGPNDWRADLTFPPATLQKELNRGMDVVGLLQFTPAWAAQNPGDGQRSVPRNLSAPASSPDNYWAQFAGRMAAQYKGRIDKWVIWNEPEFKPGDPGAGQSATWYGSDADYYLLLKRAYQAIKAANPNATVIFGATSYWVDINTGRQPFFKRILSLAAGDPEGPANGYFFDAAAFNLYWCADDILRVYDEMRDAMRAKGMDKPIWLTETNAMPYDDPATPKGTNSQRVTMQQQADFAIQALAIASAAGYQRVGWYRMTDGNIWKDQEVWGLVRDDGSKRPVFDAFKTAVGLFSGASKVSFVPLVRPDQPFGTPWPQDPGSYYPNWQVYQVVFDRPDGRRVTAVWNATDTPLRVRVPKWGTGATLVDKTGAQQPVADAGAFYVVDIAPASVKGPMDPDGYHYIGGAPMMLVETGVPAGAAVQAPTLDGATP